MPTEHDIDLLSEYAGDASTLADQLIHLHDHATMLAGCIEDDDLRGLVLSLVRRLGAAADYAAAQAGDLWQLVEDDDELIGQLLDRAPWAPDTCEACAVTASGDALQPDRIVGRDGKHRPAGTWANADLPTEA